MKRIRPFFQLLIALLVLLYITANYVSYYPDFLEDADYYGIKELPYLSEIITAGHELHEAVTRPKTRPVPLPPIQEPGLEKPKVSKMRTEAKLPELTDLERLLQTQGTLQTIMKPDVMFVPGLACLPLATTRYSYLKHNQDIEKYARSTDRSSTGHRKYFFALDLYDSAHLLPRLMATIVEIIRFLGPEHCGLSIVEGQSSDGSQEILQALAAEIKELGAEYFLTFNTAAQRAEGKKRIHALADIRNQALLPLIENKSFQYSPETRIIFLNDIALCPIDILELLHQHIAQDMHITCAMDWIDDASHFCDVWVSRTIDGDTFFEVPQSLSYENANNLFFSSPLARSRFEAKQPIQVYSCWNGATILTAEPFMRNDVAFRASNEASGECFMGEPTLLAKDFWRNGYGRIAVVPSVNIGYNNPASSVIKKEKGTVELNLLIASEWEKKNGIKEEINWEKPPKKIKCAPSWKKVSWVPAL
ncbi:putative alpha-mannosyltransferase cmt1 [Phaeomoniella chlamydospora]|uniref:Putative alpha-mannosyltransferase cmt1 n=1 Tax=Phaeomoniella chlamydospora TaxID=158046 RepID=A0A0G2EEI9_PHACM|nr:putative alpha-mannosyltransferase cmt1 [Phaeomoniella chlamydospora]